MSWIVDKVHENVHVIKVRLRTRMWEQYVLLQTDEHLDNPKCDRALLKRHHELAKKRNAPIIKGGDTFCAMQGKYDPRSSKRDLLPEHQCDGYLDALVDTAIDFYSPYADQIAVIGRGNHEESIKNRHETDLTSRLARGLSMMGGKTHAGGYGGWVRFQFQRGKSNKVQKSMKMFYHHGYGGGSPVTKGLIQFARFAEYIDADIIMAGHIHQRNYAQIQRIHLNGNNKPVSKKIRYIRCGTYKDDYKDGCDTWHVQKGQGPRPLGGWWLRFFMEGDKLQCEVIEAI